MLWGIELLMSSFINFFYFLKFSSSSLGHVILLMTITAADFYAYQLFSCLTIEQCSMLLDRHFVSTNPPNKIFTGKENGEKPFF